MTTENVTDTPLKILAVTRREERECREREGGLRASIHPLLKIYPNIAVSVKRVSPTKQYSFFSVKLSMLL